MQVTCCLKLVGVAYVNDMYKAQAHSTVLPSDVYLLQNATVSLFYRSLIPTTSRICDLSCAGFHNKSPKEHTQT